MIIDLRKFFTSERKSWNELESILNKLESEPDYRMGLEELKRFHHLYQRTCADLAKVRTFSSEPEIRRYLESLVARAYGEIHETREKPHRLDLRRWFFYTFPQTFRRHKNAFWLSLSITVLGVLFGALAVRFDPEAKQAIVPFAQLNISPSKRVEQEERMRADRLKGVKTTFAADLMTHNTQVAIFALAMGMTWGVGTIIMLFYNGVILGAIALDYSRAGHVKFLLGWLLPHGAVEIPSILFAGQAGLVLAHALIGWGSRTSLKTRLKAVSLDLVVLIFGIAVLLAWAGFIEAFLSQYHEPTIPYALKIAFGTVELILLSLFLAVSGTRTRPQTPDHRPET